MAYVARLKKEYKERIIAALTEEFGYSNVMQVPKLEKIVMSRGVGAAVADKKLIDHAIDEMTMITGQKAVATMSKKDVAAFKLRKGMPIGAKVTLRGERMYEFLDRLVTSALPRVRDFQGMKARERKRERTVAVYAEKRKVLKEAGDYEALQRLPKNASPVRLHNRCKLTGRPKGYMRTFGISRVKFREMANAGLIPGVKKASW